MITKALIETTPENRDRIKKLAEKADVTMKQAATAILNMVLPQFENGDAKLSGPSAKPADSNR